MRFKLLSHRGFVPWSGTLVPRSRRQRRDASSFSHQVAGQNIYSPALQCSLRRLDALVDWEHLVRARGSQRIMRTSTKPAADLLAAVGNPQKSFRSVHVTGSKGKGSVSMLVAAGLRTAGARTGIYGSPHVERVNERIRLENHKPIGDDELAAALKVALDAQASHAVEATWFDVMTVAGMLAFQTAQVDWGVVEVGMGGRLDSTNVLNAPVAVVTNISLEHQDIIGPSIRDIAYEKAGIFAAGCQPIVGMSAADALAPVFVNEAAIVGAACPIFVPFEDDKDIRNHNVALARCALGAALPGQDALGLLPDSAVEAALAGLPARMEHFFVQLHCCPDTASSAQFVRVLLDGAHVSDSVRRVLREAKQRMGERFVVLLAVGSEKDSTGICRAIFEAAPERVFVTRVGADARYLSADMLGLAAASAGITSSLVMDDPEAALHAALADAAKTDCNLVVIGSLHLAGRLRPALVARHVPDIDFERSMPVTSTE
jgi:dihydrofolate synthase / folylpolyglutamate synthase